MHNLVSFGTCIHICETTTTFKITHMFITPQISSCPFLIPPNPPTPPQSPATTNVTRQPLWISLQFLLFYVSGIIQYMLFFVLFLSLRITNLTFINIAVCIIPF